jgi:hypothetical protein
MNIPLYVSVSCAVLFILLQVVMFVARLRLKNLLKKNVETHRQRVNAINEIHRLGVPHDARRRLMNSFNEVTYNSHFQALVKKKNPWLLYSNELTDFLQSSGMKLN